MMKAVPRVLSFILLFFTVKTNGNMTAPADRVEANEVKPPLVGESTFHMHIKGNVFEDTCLIKLYRLDTLHTCNYNASSPLVLIIHGWSLNGIMEEWVFRMASSLKTRLGHVNVLISDWRPLALQPYPTAAKNSRQVGKDVARLLRWLEKNTRLSMEKVHLIGYSLGAHAAGFAGGYFKGARKLGRITGLDPAGPKFEGVPSTDRLSPDDAKFVDVIHTFSKSGIGLSTGIRQRVGHVDFYPNGGSFQPGCRMKDMYNNLYQFGMEGLPKAIKCAHQRSVHLFIDSLLNTDQQITAYICQDDSTFDKGLCLDCRNDRCNTLGYDARKVPGRVNGKGLYLKTGSASPYKAYHYQIKIMLTNVIEPLKSSVYISLNGTKGGSQYMPIVLTQQHAENNTFSSLAVVEMDLGEVKAVSLRWDGEDGLSSWWRRFRNMMGGSGSSQETELSVAKIRLKSGESQEKIWFCGQAGGITHMKLSEEQQFVRCQNLSKMRMTNTIPLLEGHMHKDTQEQKSEDFTVNQH